jgi:Spy/CpxP family protein refolding chaperone
MKRTRVSVMVLAVVFLAVSAACAQEKGKNHQGEQGKKENIFKELNLTPEQKKKLDENRVAQDQELSKLHSAVREKYEELEKDLKDPAVTKAAVAPLINQIKSLQLQLIDNRINGIFEVKAILTPEQFAKFNQIMEEKIKEWKSHSKESKEKPKGVHQETK